MPNFPLHFTIFISLALLSGFILAPLLAYVDDKAPIKNTTANANRLLTAMWLLAFAFTVTLIIIYNSASTPATEAQEMAKALAPFGMMIAAMIASSSVMKNIAETKANEYKKHAKENSKFYLEKCISYLEDVDTLIGKQQNDKLSWGQAGLILLSMREISQKEYITDSAHRKIFSIEYTNARLKLLRSMLNMQEDRGDIPIKPSFFCSISDWKNKTLDEAFKVDSSKIDPKRIIVVMKFLQHDRNNFLNESSDYSDWRTYNLEEYKRMLPMNFAIDYIKKYKYNIIDIPLNPL